MANPSSSHRERDRERHHHHRSISSTTLLLVLSLILAVLAVMLSLPSSRGASQSVAEPAADPSSTGIWTYLTPKRSQALVAREHAVAVREAEVAKREAELLAGSIGGVSQPVSTSSASVCAPCPTIYASPPVSAPPPIETIIKEVVREIETIGTAPPPPWWKDQVVRVEDLLQREERIGEREKDVGHREETVGKRESDAARRENWIMEQLISLGNDPAPYTVETEEFVYEPGSRNRKQLPLTTDTTLTETKTVTHTRIVPTSSTPVQSPSSTRLAASPSPEAYIPPDPTMKNRPTTAIEVTIDQEPTPSTVERTVTVIERERPTRRVPKRGFWDW